MSSRSSTLALRLEWSGANPATPKLAVQLTRMPFLKAAIFDELLAQTIRHPTRTTNGRLRQHHQEFILTPTGDAVDITADKLSGHLGKGGEYLVADAVAKGLVHPLQSIDITKDNGKVMPIALRTGQLLFQMFLQARNIR